MRKVEKYLGYLFLKLLKLSITPELTTNEKFEEAVIKNVLIIVRHQMGDMLCASPMLRAVRGYYPNAFITLVTKDSTNYQKVFGKGDCVNECINFEYGFENFVELIKLLRGKGYDLAIVPSTVVFSATNHIIAYYSKAKYRAGVSSINHTENETEFLLNIKKDFLWNSKKMHQIERNLDVIRQLNINPSDKRIRIQLNKEQLDFARGFYKEHFPDKSKLIIGFHPGAGKAGNVWDIRKYSELAGRLAVNFNAYIFISEGPADRNYVSEMDSRLKQNFRMKDTVRHYGVLMNNTALISMLDLFITNDTGIMHLAEGMSVPMIALFGSTNAYEWGPLGENKISVQSSSQDINDISVEKVYEVCVSLLKRKQP